MEAKLKRFGVYHPVGGHLNMTCKLNTHEYEYITSVESETLVRVFYRAQNDFNPEYAALGKRSTSVGDIITNGKAVFMVRGSEYKRIPRTKELYKKIIELDAFVVEQLAKDKLSQEDVDELMDNSY